MMGQHEKCEDEILHVVASDNVQTQDKLLYSYLICQDK